MEVQTIDGSHDDAADTTGSAEGFVFPWFPMKPFAEGGRSASYAAPPMLTQ